jgi:hypothetical protein
MLRAFFVFALVLFALTFCVSAQVPRTLYYQGVLTDSEGSAVPDGAWQSFTDIGSGNLPSGASGQTLYHTGSSWAATSNLFNDGTNIGIGTTAPTSALEIMGGLLRCRRNAGQYLDIKNMDHMGSQITGHSPENAKKSVCINALHDESGSPSGETFIRFSVGPESAWRQSGGISAETGAELDTHELRAARHYDDHQAA